MKQEIKLGVVCLARKTFDFEGATKIFEEVVADLGKIDAIEVILFPDVCFELEDATACGNLFAREQVDSIAVISGTFHLGHLVLEIKNKCDKPLLLWGFPELPYDGGKIRLNSVCGVNLNASNLTKSGHTDFSYSISSSIDMDWLNAVRMKKALKEANVGILGSRAHGFFNVGVDELSLYKKYGCVVDYCDLEEVIKFEENRERTAYFNRKEEKYFNLEGISKNQKEKVAKLASKLEAFMENKNLSVLAVRCWPEFASRYGISPCASMSLLQEEGLILACEGDVDCGITMLCHAAAGATTPFMADLSQVNMEENTAIMWHCGVAPSNLADGICLPTLDTYFAGGKGVTAGFVMKSGDINIARLDSINGHYRLFLERGRAIPMEKQIAGTYAKCEFENGVQKVLDKVVYSGIAHHVSMVYGDWTRAFQIFARLTHTELL